MKKLTFLLFFVTAFLNAQTKAFPGAFGAGAYVTGGRGGAVLHVTNLNNSGTGSLRTALNTSGARTIVFDVSGIINLTSEIQVNDGNVTIAGQTAPEGGIMIDGARVFFYDIDNIIIRYIKFRGGMDDTSLKVSLLMNHTSNVILDHCSFGYATDKCVNIGGDEQYQENITVQNCLFAQSQMSMLIGDSSNTVFWGGVSVLRNVYCSSGYRVPLKGSGMDLDVINNLVHNFDKFLMRFDPRNYKLNHIGNYYQAGSGSGSDGLQKTHTNNLMFPQIYQEDNFVSNSIKPVGYDSDESVAWSLFADSTEPIQSEWFVDSAHTLQGAAIPILAASVLKDSLLPTVGACKYLNADGSVGFYRDSLDEDYVNQVDTYASTARNISGALPTSLPASPRPAGYDTDNDGMPDTWEIANGLDEDVADDDGNDLDANYTNLEMFLNLVDGEIVEDTEDPTSPTGLGSSSITSNAFTLTWTASTDNVGVTSYDVYRGVTLAANVTSGTSYNETGLSPSTAYTYTVVAKDSAGNSSTPSSGIEVTTTAASTETVKVSKGQMLLIN